MSNEPAVEIRLLEPDEAHKLVACIRRCYGDTYIDPAFYDEANVRSRIAEGTLYSIGALSEAGELVGHMAITRRPGASTSADAGMTLVDPDWRGQGIAHAVAAGLGRQCRALGLAGVHDYPVTVHAATQRLGGGIGIETGLLLANMPADVSFRDMGGVGGGRRTSSIIRWLPSGAAPPRPVHLPERYAERIEALHAEAGLERIRHTAAALVDAESEVLTAFDERRSLLRLRVEVAGRNLVECVLSEVDRAVAAGACLAHVDLSLSDATTPAASGALNQVGFAFAGLLPEYRDDDVLRLQWLQPGLDDLEAVVLEGEATRAISTFVLDDRRALADSTGATP